MWNKKDSKKNNVLFYSNMYTKFLEIIVLKTIMKIYARLTNNIIYRQLQTLHSIASILEHMRTA